MPRELRYIIFSKDEAIIALSNFARHRRRPIVLGHGRRLQIDRGPPVACTFGMHEGSAEPAGAQPAGGLVAQYRFDEIEIAAALVLACIDSNIPVPATRLHKSVQAFDDHLVLIMTKGVPANSVADVGFCLTATRELKTAPGLATGPASGA